MLIKKYYQNNGCSIYECDRCKKVIDTAKERRIRIAAEECHKSKYHLVKSWDLCMNCFVALQRGIAKGVNKK